jgi:hypothetical protein
LIWYSLKIWKVIFLSEPNHLNRYSRLLVTTPTN